MGGYTTKMRRDGELNAAEGGKMGYGFVLLQDLLLGVA